MLFDCGEGTQRQMMRYGTGFAGDAIFITHMHADHFLGITGLLRTMGLQGRTEPLELYGPSGGQPTLEVLEHLGTERSPFEVPIRELAPGDTVRRDGYDVLAFAADHGIPALGYALAEHERLGRFDVERARALGIPEGPLFGRLHRGEPVEVDGRTISTDEVVGRARSGRRVVYTGDTRPSGAISEVARGADLLVHECTFSAEEADRSQETYHATAAGAAIEAALRAGAALEAGVRRLVLTHISARYADNPRGLEEEAAVVFPRSQVAQDGLVIEIPFAACDD